MNRRASGERRKKNRRIRETKKSTRRVQITALRWASHNQQSPMTRAMFSTKGDYLLALRWTSVVSACSLDQGHFLHSYVVARMHRTSRAVSEPCLCCSGKYRWMFRSVVSVAEVVDPGNNSPSGRNNGASGTLDDQLQQCRKDNEDLRRRLRRYETAEPQPGSPPSGERSSGSAELRDQLEACKRREKKLLEEIESLKRVSRR